MSTLNQILERAEAKANDRAAEVASIMRSREQLKDVEKAARRDHRATHSAFVFLRGAIERISRLPDGPEILSGEMSEEVSEPVLVTLPEPVEPGRALPFTPALDHPDSHPVEIPKRMVDEPLLPVSGSLPEETRHEPSNVREVPLTAAMLGAVQSPVPVTSEPAVTAVSPLQERVLGMLDSYRGSSPYASFERKELQKRLGASDFRLTKALEALVTAGRLQKINPTATSEPGWSTYKVLAVVEQAA